MAVFGCGIHETGHGSGAMPGMSKTKGAPCKQLFEVPLMRGCWYSKGGCQVEAQQRSHVLGLRRPSLPGRPSRWQKTEGRKGSATSLTGPEL